MATAQKAVAGAERWFQKYGQRVADMLGLALGTPNFVFLTQEQLNEKTQQEGAIAAADGRNFYIGPKYDPSNEGAIVHEAVHFLQMSNGLEGVSPKWVEAMADAVRNRMGLTDASKNDPDGWSASGRASRLSNLKPWQFQAVNEAMTNGTFDKSMLNDLADGRITPEQFAKATGMPLTGGSLGGSMGPNQPIPDIPSGGGGDFDTTQPPGGGGDDGSGLTDRQKEKRHEQRTADRKNLRSGFVNAVREFGIPMTQNVQQLINAGIEGKYNYDRFLNYLRQTPEYRKTFPGIFDDDGGLKMSEAQYLSNKTQYEQYASRYGVNLSEGKMAWLFKNDVDPSEFADRAPSITRLRENKDLYGAFAKELVDSGVATRKEVDSPKEMFRFVMGAGNKAWYDLWQDSATRYQAEEAGLSFVANKQGYTNLNQRIIERISGKGLSEEAMAEGFSQVAEDLLTVLPLSRIQQYGLSKRDIVTAQFGGKGSARIREKMKKIIAQDEAFHENRATTPMYASEEGVQTLGGNKQKAQTY